MKITMLKIFMVFMFLSLSAGSAYAFTSSTCKIFYKNKILDYGDFISSHSVIKRLNSQEDGTALQVCYYNWLGKRFYNEYTKIFLYDGVCVYNKIPLFEDLKNNQWSYNPITDEDVLHSYQASFMALQEEGTCAYQGSSKYSKILHLTPGVFKIVAEGLESIFESTQSFEEAFKTFQVGKRKSDEVQTKKSLIDKSKENSIRDLISNGLSRKYKISHMNHALFRNQIPYIAVTIKEKPGVIWRLSILLKGRALNIVAYRKVIR